MVPCDGMPPTNRHLRTAILSLVITLSGGSVSAQGWSYTFASGVRGSGFSGQAMSRMGITFCDLDIRVIGNVTDLWAEVSLWSASGQLLRRQTGQSYSTRLRVRFEQDLPDRSPGGQYRCTAIAYVFDDRTDLEAPFNIRTPNSVATAVDRYNYQFFNNYERYREYQVKDSGGADWHYKSATVSESWSPWVQNGCNLMTITPGGGETNNIGRFFDRYFMSGSPVCPSNPNCQSSADQTYTVGGYQVRRHRVTYRCSSVDVP